MENSLGDDYILRKNFISYIVKILKLNPSKCCQLIPKNECYINNRVLYERKYFTQRGVCVWSGNRLTIMLRVDL